MANDDFYVETRVFVKRRYGPVGRPCQLVIDLDDDLEVTGTSLVLVPQPDNDSSDINGCLRDVITVLAVTGHRLTTSLLIEKLEEERMIWGESNLKKHLAAAVKAGILTTDPKADPPGYGLPTWA